MTKEDRQLLLIDISARLSYSVIGRHREKDEYIATITPEGAFQNRSYNGWFDIETFKPYLRSMSNMTKTEYEEYTDIKESASNILGRYKQIDKFDWLNSHHFDYRGLIEKNLAIEVDEDDNPYK